MPFRAEVRRSGTDLSLIAFGGSVTKALAAADELARSGLSAEVVDLRSLRPFDEETVLRSVKKTHRVVVIDEAWKSGSFAAEVVARVAENALYDLDGPPRRICSKEVPLPYARQQQAAALPEAARIAAAAREVMGRAGV